MTPDLKQVVLLLRAHRIAIHVPPTNDSYSRKFDLCQEAANAIERLYAEVWQLRQAAGAEAGLRRQVLTRAESAEERKAKLRMDRTDCALPKQPDNGTETIAQLNQENTELRETILALLQELENWRGMGRELRAIANENIGEDDNDDLKAAVGTLT
jgi:hypothetical protein